jgi:hypothetical protein
MQTPVKKPDPKLEVHLIEDRRTVLSRWGKGNGKLGPDVYTYSKLPGREFSCPGSTDSCEAYCYAKRVSNDALVRTLWKRNSEHGDHLPELPEGVKIVRFHVSGDFDTANYIQSWIQLVRRHPETTFFGWTRSWRVPGLDWHVEKLRDEPNVFLWASVDAEMTVLPKAGWRRAFVDGDERLTTISDVRREFEGKPAMVCPEQRGVAAHCQGCTFCFKKKEGMDLVFLKH